MTDQRSKQAEQTRKEFGETLRAKRWERWAKRRAVPLVASLALSIGGVGAACLLHMWTTLVGAALATLAVMVRAIEPHKARKDKLARAEDISAGRLWLIVFALIILVEQGRSLAGSLLTLQQQRLCAEVVIATTRGPNPGVSYTRTSTCSVASLPQPDR